MYRADGRKVFDIYTANPSGPWPYSIRTAIKKELGAFPFATFWGPAAGIRTPQGAADAASRWIAASAKWIETQYHPTLSLIYLPHLDYNLQRHGPFGVPPLGGGSSERREAETGSPDRLKAGHQTGLNPAIIPDLRAIDAIVGDLIDFFAAQSVKVILLSEYGITNVNWPVHLNRVFRSAGWLAIREELGLEILDCGASKVFAVADHQVAHIYLNDRSLEKKMRSLLQKTEGVGNVMGEKEKAAAGIDHPRAGDLIVVAEENAWFTYYYWLEDRLAPDFARTVDIHRKPGYDPVELFLDPQLKLPKLRIAWRLLQKKLGLRMLMDVVPLDATLLKGSHGRRPADEADYPILISQERGLLSTSLIEATDVYHLLKRQVLG